MRLSKIPEDHSYVKTKKASTEPGLSLSMHNEAPEAIRAISSFLKFHPTSEIRIWGNEPQELNQVGMKFGIPVINSPQYVNKLTTLLHSQDSREPEKAAEILREFLRTIHFVYSGMKCEYVVYMHPDHLVVRKFKISRLKYDLEIHKVNRYSLNQKEAWREVTGKNLKLKSYGLAGYFRREALVTAIEFLLDEKTVQLDLLMSKDLDFIFEDLIIPCAFDYLGFTIKDQGFTREIRRKKRIRLLFRRPIMFHQVEKLK